MTLGQEGMPHIREHLERVTQNLTINKHMSKDIAEYYDKLYEKVDEMQEESGMASKTQCVEQECSFCCHDLIMGSADEIRNLARYVKKNNIPINKKHNQYKGNWNKLKFAQKACPLLINGKCGAYDKRPLICRKHNIRKGEDISKCNVDNGGVVQEVILVELDTILIADILINEGKLMCLNFELLGNGSVINKPPVNGKLT